MNEETAPFVSLQIGSFCLLGIETYETPLGGLINGSSQPMKNLSLGLKETAVKQKWNMASGSIMNSGRFTE